MAESHAQIARRLTITMKPGVFAHAARDAVIHHDFSTLERMFPGMIFGTHAVGPDRWELFGWGEDGSTVTWDVGG